MIHNLWIIKYDQFVGYQLSIEKGNGIKTYFGNDFHYMIELNVTNSDCLPISVLCSSI